MTLLLYELLWVYGQLGTLSSKKNQSCLLNSYALLNLLNNILFC